MATKVKLIETGAVTGNIIPDGGIATGKLADDAVTTIKISDANITHAKLHTSMDLTGKTVTVATAAGSTNTTAAASTAFVQQELTTLIGGAPSTLNDLNELAAAINDDANYNSTLTTALATKLPLAGGTMTGALDVGGTITGDDGLSIQGGTGNAYLQVGSDTGSWTWKNYRSTHKLALEDSDGTGEVLNFDTSGNATFAGTISSGDVNITSTAPTIFFTDSDGTNQNTTVKQSGGNFFIIARDNTANAGVVFAGNAGGTYDEYARFKADGNFGIRTNNPSETLELTRLGKIGFGMNGDYGARLGYFDDGGGVHGFHVDTKHGGTTVSESRLVVRADSGNVGIGTKSPDSLLEIHKSSTNSDINYLKISMPSWSNQQGKLKSIVWDDSSNVIAGIGAEFDGGKTNIHFHSQYNGGYKATSVRTMSILGSGNVGIGTSNPAFKLVVAHNGRNGMEFVPNTDDAGTNIIQNYNRGTAAYTPLRIAGSGLTLLSGTNAQHSTSIDTSGNIATSGNINLTGGGTIEAPSSGGGEDLHLKAAGGVTVRIDSNSNGGDGEYFKVLRHAETTSLFSVQENGAVEVAGTLNSGGTLSATASVGVNLLFKSTYNYGPNRDWAFRTNNYGSSNWGGWSLEQSGEQQGTPDIARIGVHANGNVGIRMGGHASSGLTTINPATALHVGGDITVGTAESVGTGAAAAIRFVNDNERARITSNYAAGGGGQMGFWTDSTGGTLLQRAYVKNDGSFNFNGNVKMHSNNWNSNDVLRAYSITGPSTNSLTRTINVNSYWGFGAQGGAFMFMIHGWQSDSATGMVHWHNNGSNSAVITGVYLNEFHTATGLTVSVAKGTGDYDINISLASTHSNTHGWYWKVWA